MYARFYNTDYLVAKLRSVLSRLKFHESSVDYVKHNGLNIRREGFGVHFAFSGSILSFWDLSYVGT